jgi:DNA-binding NarL/FixJ family response regulator
MIQRRILLADDHPVFRRGLRAVIEETGRYQVVAEADNGEAAIQALAAHSPDLAVVDLAMPRKDGFEVARWAAERRPETRIVLLTLYKATAYVDRAVALGVSGYVVKDDAESQIVHCLDTVHDGEFYASPNLSRPSAPPPPIVASDNRDLDKLTPAQRAVLRLVANYRTSREIAEVLGISVKTVENHRANSALRLNLHGPNALLRYAVRNREML